MVSVGSASLSKSHLLCLFGVSIIAILFLNVVLLVRHDKEPSQFAIQGAEASYHAMITWPDTVAASRARAKRFVENQDPLDFDFLYFEDCWNDREWLRMYTDPYCMFLWMSSLESGHVSALENILSVITQQERKQTDEIVKSNQNGGMRCIMDGLVANLNIMGYWKPCTTEYLPQNGETFKSEIVAFHIDRLLGFYRTPPVVPFYFEKEELYRLAKSTKKDKMALFKVQTVMDKCGTTKGAEGAMVGWSNFPIRVLDRANKQLKDQRLVNMLGMKQDEIDLLQNTRFNITNESSVYARSWVLENVAVNMFTILVGNPRKFSHSVFVLEKKISRNSKMFGPLVYVDNDRSSWDSNIFSRGVVKEKHPLTQFCKFPADIAARILAVDGDKVSVGNLLMQAVSAYDDSLHEYPLFTKTNAFWLDQRVVWLRNIIETCILEHGADNVLFPEPWYENQMSNENIWLKALPKKGGGESDYDFFANRAYSRINYVYNNK